MKKIIVIIPILFVLLAGAQDKDEEKAYIWPTDEKVLEKLDDWQDLKLGLLMHWGPYSQWGIVESWSICPEDYDWIERKNGSNPGDYYTYKKEYENLKFTFNPIDFEPERWAKAAKDAGMKYVVFTTKHHDGFCMFDTKYTDYKITSKECPFSSNSKADITKEIFDAFRAEGLWTGAYFSKPDWHSQYYWDPKFPPFDRNVNYDPELYPEKWEKYVKYTQNQIMELMTDYGKIDILWLDGGQVAKKQVSSFEDDYKAKLKDTSTGFIKNREISQDIRMDEIAIKAREKQPGLIVVDRTIRGSNQNYLTPENIIPEAPLSYPWESCMITGGGWSWRPADKFITPKQAIHMLVDIVSKGGNLLLNIGPGPDGKWPDDAYKLLDEIGKWIRVNGEAIYSTRAISPYKTENICLTQKKDSKVIYAIYLEQEDGKGLPEYFNINGIFANKNAKLNLLGTEGNLKWQNTDKGLKIFIPSKITNSLPCGLAWVVKISDVQLK